MSNISWPMAPLTSEAYRLIHGRGNCIAGAEAFNIEWFPPVMLVVAYQALSDEQISELTQYLSAQQGVKGVYLQERHLPGAPLRALCGDAPLPTQCTEQGLHYQLDLGDKQNFGIFLDMLGGRQWVREHSQNARVLNLFAYTCGFAVAALAGGAELVVNLDMSQAALNVGRNNLRLNQLDTKKARFLAHDLFKTWGKLRKLGPYDLVIADPPSLQKGSFNVEKDYARIVRQLPSLLSEKGKALLCLNAPWLPVSFITDTVQENAPQLKLLEVLARPANIVEKDEDSGLKVLVFENSAE